MLSLFRCSTLEDWTDVMYTNMYGCDLYGYDLWETMQEDLCKQPQAQEAMAAVYFLTFTVISSLVMLSLFIGVVTTSMSESAEVMKKEEETKKKVKKLIKEEKCTQDQVDDWKHVFETFDRDDSKSIDTEEMMWVMTAMGAETMEDEHGRTVLTKENQEKVEKMIQRADSNGDGDVDFCEFCELMSQVNAPHKWTEKKQKNLGP